MLPQRIELVNAPLPFRNVMPAALVPPWLPVTVQLTKVALLSTQQIAPPPAFGSKARLPARIQFRIVGLLSLQ